MDLVFATEDFQIHGRSYPGFPILLDRHMDVVEPAHHFLVHECLQRGRVQSTRSWEAYGRTLYDFFGFLEANDLDWRDVGDRFSHSILAAYRDWAIDECGLKASTVNDRLGLIARYYYYALDQGWIASLPFDIETVKVRQPRGFLAHADANAGEQASPDVMLRQRRTETKVLSRAQVAELLHSISNPTLNLMTRLGLQTGLRREEIATFPLRYVVDPARHDARSSLVRVTLNPTEMKTKNDQERRIDVPARLMADMAHYAAHTRGALERLSGEQFTQLFLNKNGRPWADGGASINNLYNRLGLTFHLTPHMLRHTYATHTLYDLRQRQVRFDPLIYVRDRLGHASITQTEGYLHLLDQIEDDVMGAYEEYIDALSAGG